MARAALGEAVVEVLSLEAGAARWICLWDLGEDESGDCEER